MQGKLNSSSILSVLQVVIGNMTYALFVKLFLLPAGLITGGTTGIALAANHFFHTSVSMVVLIFNVIMLLAGFLILGKKFALTTIISTFVYPLSLEFFDRLLGDIILTDDILLCTIFAGIGIGIGLGIVIRSGSSTGGMDIPPLVLKKYLHIPVSVSLYAFDILILLGQGAYNPAEKVLYGIILAIIYSVILDKFMILGNCKTEVKIISKKHDEIRSKILSHVDRGVTMVNGKGGYLGKPTEIVLTVISNREIPKITKLAQEIDPESFLIISRVSEVKGRGFSMKKLYN